MSASRAAVGESFTTSLIFCRMNSAAVSFAARFDQQVAERGAELEPALRPGRLVDRLPLFGRDVVRPPVADHERMPVRRGVHDASEFGRIVLGPALELLGQRRVAGGDAVVRGALENGQVRRAAGDHRSRLDSGRAGADHADALAGKIDALMRPLPGVMPIAGEATSPGMFGILAADRQPTAVIRNFASYALPAAVVHPASGSPPHHREPLVTRAPKRMSRRRSNRLVT